MLRLPLAAAAAAVAGVRTRCAPLAPAAAARLPALARSNSTDAGAAAPAGDAPASGSAPAYTITDAPGAAVGGTKKWGRFVLRGIRGHTKKLNPVARQVRSPRAGAPQQARRGDRGGGG